MAGYPMTPATSIMEYFADKGRQYNIATIHVEDEISAINMAIGVGFAGVRSMTATSGGGIVHISIGKLRGLQQLANTAGFMTICANDHRGALRRALNNENPEAVSYQEMVEFKLDLCHVVAEHASAILLDPVYGVGQAITANVLPGHIGLLVSLEKTGYSGSSTTRVTELLPNFSVQKAKQMGASAIKLLIYFRPDLKELAKKQLDLVADVAEDCIREDIALLVEPVSYPVEDIGVSAKKFADMKPELVIETARQITSLPIDVLKAEFPADMLYESDEAKLLGYCQELNKASRLPWVLLSAGVDFQTFSKQVKIACESGASGFLAGRALWQEGVAIKSREERLNFMRNTTLPRLMEIADIVNKYATPWFAKFGVQGGVFSSPDQYWYNEY